jgi:hypothetical protein
LTSSTERFAFYALTRPTIWMKSRSECAMAIVGRSLQSRQRKRAACHRDRPCENPWTIVGRGRRRGATGLGHGDDRLQLPARPESPGSDHHAHVAQNGAIAEDRSQTADHASLQARHDHGCIRHLRRRGQNERAKLSSKRRRSSLETGKASILRREVRSGFHHCIGIE